MNICLTKVYGFAPESVVLLSQNEVKKILYPLIDKEMSIYAYQYPNEPDNELSSRYDGIIAGVSAGDVVIMQSPTWNGVAWDNGLVDRIRAYGCKIIMFIQDVPSLQFENNYFLMPELIDMYNKSELVIVPSKKMYDRLVQEGLKVKKYVIQGMWDFKNDIDLHTPRYMKKLYFTGDISRFPFLQSWKYSDILYVFGNLMSEYDYSKIHFGGWLNKSELLLELSKGGFGLVWGNTENPSDERDYYKMNCSYKLASYLSAGIPVVVPYYLSNVDYIKEKGIGFVVSSLEEASRVVQECTEEKYNEMVHNLKHVQYLINNGYFTKKLFVDAIMMLD